MSVAACNPELGKALLDRRFRVPAFAQNDMIWKALKLPGVGKMMDSENGVRKVDASAAVDIDWGGALKRVGGSKEALQELVEIFCADECPECMQYIRDALVKEDAVLLGRAAHTLKSSADLFGGTRAFEAARTLEEMAGESDFQGAARTWETLEQELANLQAALASLEP